MDEQGNSMKVGDLIKMIANDTLWLVVDIYGDDALLQNAATSQRMWTTWNLAHGVITFEVISAG